MSLDRLDMKALENYARRGCDLLRTHDVWIVESLPEAAREELSDLSRRLWPALDELHELVEATSERIVDLDAEWPEKEQVAKQSAEELHPELTREMNDALLAHLLAKAGAEGYRGRDKHIGS
jgi:hypothetical protein